MSQYDYAKLVEYAKEFKAGEKESGLQVLRAPVIQTIISRACAQWIPEYELKEVQHLCHIIIIKVLKKFEFPLDLSIQAQGEHLVAYFRKFLKLRLLDELDKLRKLKSNKNSQTKDGQEYTTVSLDAEIDDVDGCTTSLHESVASDQPSVEDVVILNDALSHLTPTQQRIIRMAFWNKMTHEDIAQELGISRPAVTQHINNCLGKLKGLLS